MTTRAQPGTRARALIPLLSVRARGVVRAVRAVRAAPYTAAGRAVGVRAARSPRRPRGQVTEVSGALATVAAQAGHAVLAARGEWITDEKRLLTLAGLCGFDAPTSGPRPEPEALVQAVEQFEALLEGAG
ncbi:hypothetical protein ABZ686_01515 [Streptomyces sp. NPDC006992]|uniref:hypothetical protein n=1 Tax=unclassified Streptomyces TaxID=2593676 RepID=UPI0033E1677C